MKTLEEKSREIRQYLFSRSFDAGEGHGDCFHAVHVVRAINHYEDLMKGIASLAWDAGYQKNECEWTEPFDKQPPTKEQFLNSIFNPNA